jgi:hypothetical protein
MLLRLCPMGQENYAFFNCLFLNKLPRELHILLLEADMMDKQALGAIAGLFTAHNSKHAHDVVAAVAASSLQEQGEEPTVAAVRHGASRGQSSCGGRQRGVSGRGKKKHGHGGGGGSGGSGQQVSHVVSHVKQARLETGLCFNPFSYGPRSRRAAPPSPGQETSWSGADQHRRRRAADPHAGRDLQQAFPRGHRCFLLHPPTPFFPTCLAWQLNLYLAGETA